MIADQKLRQYLSRVGYSPGEIDEMTLETTLFGDLALDGDSFLEAIECLHKEFGCDMSGYNWRKYSHSESELLSPLYVVKRLIGLDRQLTHITLGMIEETLHEGRWIYG